MKMNVNIELEILWNTDETSSLEKLNIDFSFDDCNVKLATFYSIDAVLPVEIDKEKYDYSKILSSGQVFIVRKPVKEIVKIVNENILLTAKLLKN